MTVQELIDKLNGYKDKNMEVEFTIGARTKKTYSRARFMISGTTSTLKLTPVKGSEKACIQIYP